MSARRLVAWMLATSAGCGGGLGGSGSVLDDRSLGVDPPSISFGSVTVGDEATRDVTIRHTGTEGTVTITGIERAEGTSEEFTWDEPTARTLERGQAATLRIRYRPTRGEAASGSIVIRHDVPPDLQAAVAVSAIGQFGELAPVPPIDFDKVPLAELPKTDDFRLENRGTKAVAIDRIVLMDLDGVFSLAPDLVTPSGKPLPIDLAPRESVGLVVTFDPPGVGCAWHAQLWVYSGTDRYDFPVTGCAVGPACVVAPGLVEFGWVGPGETATRALEIGNAGELDCEVGAVLPALGSNAGLAVVDGPSDGAPWRIATGGKRSVSVTWTASLQAPPTDGDLGGFSFVTNGHGPLVVPAKGDLDVPRLEPDPELVDFGFVAQGIAAERVLVLDNAGHGALTVTGLAIDPSTDPLGEFAILPDPEFPPAGGTGPGTVEGYETRPVKLRFTNQGDPQGCVTATLVIESDSPDATSWPIALKACRSGKPTCEPKLVPPAIAFGTLAVGTVAEKQMRIRNAGTGYCKILATRIVDCASLTPGLPKTCPKPLEGTASKVFAIASGPAPGEQIGPGSDAVIDVRFEAPSQGVGLMGLVMDFQSILGAKILDDNGAQPIEVVLPATSAPNVSGGSGLPKMTVLPGKIGFGLVTLGCGSKTYSVCMYNGGNALLTITDVAPSGCSPEFKLKDVPPLPLDLHPGVPKCFGATYVPQQEGKQSCAIRIASNDPTAPFVSVLMDGAGTLDSSAVDEFVEPPGNQVDALFVIDDSSSMCDDQENLIAAYPSFIQHADLGNDYHVGVISLNVVDDPVIGKLNRGEPERQPRFITPNPNAAQQFAKLANLECGSNSSQQESGLEAAQVALSAPLTTDTGKPCGTDADCANDPTLCGAADACPYKCLDGTCGGYNKGFLRDDAQLEIIVLSDEEDQSPGSLPFYEDFFRSIKGWFNQGMIHFHAIAWHQAACEQTSAESDGKRYSWMAKAFGGVDANLCAMLEYVMDDIGVAAFQPKVQFFLSRLADPPTIVVEVAGAQCKQGWNYDAPSNSVVFVLDGPCMPKPGDTIRVSYKSLCLQG